MRRDKGAWQAMITRCYNPRSKTFKYYGAKGIAVDISWWD